jgi:ABC-2 type transport system ATP-binding protein
VIAVEHLVKRFGSQIAVNDVSFTVGAGELFALLGPNGAGKSTTLACLLGFAVPDAGRALVCGIDVARDPTSARQRTAYIPEQVSLYEDFTAAENVSYFAALAGRRRTTREAEALLEQAGLQAAAHHARTATFSKGMRQKVGIAIALAKEAQALLLDEPTSGLDPSAAREFALALGELRRRGVAVLMATHDLFRTLQDATTIGIMQAGSLVARHSGASLAPGALEQLYLEAVTGTAALVPDSLRPQRHERIDP